MNQADSSSLCGICGSALKHSRTDGGVCCYCGTAASNSVTCANNHVICDSCRRSDPLNVIQNYILATSEKNPMLIAELSMGHPGLPMIGCEHAGIAGGAVAAGLRNSRYGRIGDSDIREVFTRTAAQAVRGYCGFTGVCGVAASVGACIAVFLDSRPGSDTEQKIVMGSVVRVAKAIADLTGPSCCKAYVRAAVSTAVDIFSERFGIVLPQPPDRIICRHGSRYPQGCREEKCPYYKKELEDPLADGIRLTSTVCHS